jgi:hypothetical protein
MHIRIKEKKKRMSYSEYLKTRNSRKELWGHLPQCPGGISHKRGHGERKVRHRSHEKFKHERAQAVDDGGPNFCGKEHLGSEQRLRALNLWPADSVPLVLPSSRMWFAAGQD